MKMAASRPGMGQPKKKKMKDMNIDEFLSGGINNDSESNDSPHRNNVNGNLKSQLKADKNIIKSKPKKQRSKSRSTNDNVVTVDDSLSLEVESKSKKGMEGAFKKGNAKKKKGQDKKKSKMIKPSLAKTLQETDPEFYEYLKGEDASLLNNLEDLSDEEDSDDEKLQGGKNGKDSFSPQDLKKFEADLLNLSSDDDVESEDDNNQQYNVHKFPDKLEVASDDSGTESEDDQSQSSGTKTSGKGISVTNKLLSQWADQLQKSPSPRLFKEIVSAFHGAVYEAGGKTDESIAPSSKYKVKGSSAFNGIVRLCLLHVAPALQKILRIPNVSSLENVDKIKKWGKVKTFVKSYISSLLQLLAQLSEAAMINAILKHIHKLVVFYAAFPKTARTLMKQMIKMWTTGEETSRVLAFLCINKLIHLKRNPFLELCVKKLYMAYVSNCKFVSPTALPLINFMQRSLVEVLSNDFVMAYQYAFVYIRQLAIHLRNAISVKKKDMFQIVYNWQYVHCLGLWVQLLSSHPNETLKPLVYPLTQTIIGTIKLVPTARFYPLRFHCVKLLNILSLKTNTYIPTLPFLLDVFEQTDFNKRHKSVSLKPFNFSIILKFSKGQLHEKAFKDGLIDQLYELLLESYNIYAHSVGFPELIIPSLLQLKDFNKKCKITNYCKQIKQIIEKIEEQSKFIVDRRKMSTLRLDDLQGVHHWEQNIDVSPLRKYYISWRKLRDRELQHEIANKEAISGAAIDIPSITYKKKLNKATPEERESLSKLFENDSDSDNETRFMLKEERPESSKKRKRGSDDDESDSDDYSDFDDDELEQLAKSASEGESDSEEDIEVDDSDEDGSENEEDMDEEDEEDDNDEEDSDTVEIPSKKSKKNAVIVSKPNRGKPSKEFSSLADVDAGDDVVEDFVLSDSD